MPKLTARLEICGKCAVQLAETDEGVLIFRDHKPAANRLNIACVHVAEAHPSHFFTHGGKRKSPATLDKN